MFLTPILALAVASKASCPSSGISAVGQCFTPYFAAYNFTLFPDFSTFDEAISRVINAQGWSGMEQYCNVENTLVSCLGNNAGCVTGPVLMKNYNVTNNDAYGYAGNYAETAYYCGQGFNLLKQYFSCMVGLSNSNDTNACVTQAIGDFQNGKICKGYNDLTYCYGNVYTKTCGAGISLLICNMLQKDFQQQDGTQKCKWFDCSKPYPYNGTAF